MTTAKVSLTAQAEAVRMARRYALPTKSLRDTENEFVAERLDAAAKTLDLFARFEDPIRDLVAQLLEAEKGGAS